MTTNLRAVLGVTLTYVNEEEAADAITPITVACQYQGQCHGSIDVPASEAADTVHTVPFGSVAKASCVVIVNRTAQELEVTINTIDTTMSIPVGGTMVFGSPTFPAAQHLASMSLKTTVEQVAAGKIGFHVFGDAV